MAGHILRVSFKPVDYKEGKRSNLVLSEFHHIVDAAFLYLSLIHILMAKVAGITKTNTSVFPEKRGDGYCARLDTQMCIRDREIRWW